MEQVAAPLVDIAGIERVYVSQFQQYKASPSSVDVLREFRAFASDTGDFLSYYRRMIQGRVDTVKALADPSAFEIPLYSPDSPVSAALLDGPSPSTATRFVTTSFSIPPVFAKFVPAFDSALLSDDVLALDSLQRELSALRRRVYRDLDDATEVLVRTYRSNPHLLNSL